MTAKRVVYLPAPHTMPLPPAFLYRPAFVVEGAPTEECGKGHGHKQAGHTIVYCTIQFFFFLPLGVQLAAVTT